MLLYEDTSKNLDFRVVHEGHFQDEEIVILAPEGMQKAQYSKEGFLDQRRHCTPQLSKIKYDIIKEGFD